MTDTENTPSGSTPEESDDRLLDVRRVSVVYGRGTRNSFQALDNVSLDIMPGECVGLVGESGSGKSTLGKAVLGLEPVKKGTIRFNGMNITRVGHKVRRRLASQMQVVFQDPYGSLDPYMTVGDILAEPLTVGGGSKVKARKQVAEMLELVQLPTDSLMRYPGEFSGGQRQRIAIARALVRKPKLIVCDEAVSALDLTTQYDILELFTSIQRETGVAYLFITHDLGVVRRMSHRIYVLHRGEIVEHGPAEQITRHPEHAYTQKLLLASPVANPEKQARRREEWLALR